MESYNPQPQQQDQQQYLSSIPSIPHQRMTPTMVFPNCSICLETVPFGVKCNRCACWMHKGCSIRRQITNRKTLRGVQCVELVCPQCTWLIGRDARAQPLCQTIRRYLPAKPDSNNSHAKFYSFIDPPVIQAEQHQEMIMRQVMISPYEKFMIDQQAFKENAAQKIGNVLVDLDKLDKEIKNRIDVITQHEYELNTSRQCLNQAQKNKATALQYLKIYEQAAIQANVLMQNARPSADYIQPGSQNMSDVSMVQTIPDQTPRVNPVNEEEKGNMAEEEEKEPMLQGFRTIGAADAGLLTNHADYDSSENLNDPQDFELEQVDPSPRNIELDHPLHHVPVPQNIDAMSFDESANYMLLTGQSIGMRTRSRIPVARAVLGHMRIQAQRERGHDQQQ